MIWGPVIAIAAIALQSIGKVLYGEHLDGVSTALFMLIGALAATTLFLAVTRFRLPEGGRRLMLANNVWTAVAFLAFFFALKELPAGTVAAAEIGISLIAAVVMSSIGAAARPHWTRLVACTGIAAGCALLVGVELADAVEDGTAHTLWPALLACLVTGIAGAFTVVVAGQLSAIGWSSPAVLAHRFYLTIAATSVWVLVDKVEMPTVGVAGTALAVCAIALLLPMLLMQIAIRRVDALTVLVCMAFQPILSFGCALVLSGYAWDALAFAGVATVTLFACFDVVASHRLQAQPAPAR
jgi:drug/metabolite transporter (DMT)-like permease